MTQMFLWVELFYITTVVLKLSNVIEQGTDQPYAEHETENKE